MGIDAVALLRGTEHALSPHLHVRPLEDGLLVSTGVRFGGSPDELGLALRISLGEALDAHDDPRGVFVLPDVAEPRARTYEGVIAEIGEAGEWAPRVAAGQVPAAFADAPAGSFAGLVGQMMAALGDGTLDELQRALATGDVAAMERAQEKLVAALGGEERVAALSAELLGAAQNETRTRPDAPAGMPNLPIEGEEIDFDSPEMAAILRQVEQQLDADPERRAELLRVMREAGGGADDEGDAPKKAPEK